MAIDQLKANLLSTLNSIDREKLSLPDLNLYAQILRTASEIQTKSYTEYLAETFASAGGLRYSPPAVSELK